MNLVRALLPVVIVLCVLAAVVLIAFDRWLMWREDHDPAIQEYRRRRKAEREATLARARALRDAEIDQIRREQQL